MAAAKFMKMVNIGDSPITIRIGGTPCSGVSEFHVQPGAEEMFPENYCTPVKGAGRTDLPPILERQSTMECADGVRRAMLVPSSEAKTRKAQMAREIEAWKKNPPKPVQPEVAAARN